MSDFLPQEHEILVRGGTILTMSEPRTADAMLVRGSRIARVGNERECVEAAIGQHPEVIDLERATLMPGFIDAHCHPLMFGQFQTWADCSWESAPDVASVIDTLKSRGRDLEDAQAAIRGRGYHHGNVAEQRHLRRQDLDEVADDREVLVFHSSGHGAYVNSWKLREMGVDSGIPDPQGGHLGREADNSPNGEVWDAAADLLTGPDGVKIGNHGPNFHLSDPAEVLVSQLALAQQLIHSAGVTSVLDAQVTQRELMTYMALRSRGGLTMRVEMLVLSSLLGELERLGLGGRIGDEQFGFAGVKLYLDGALTAGTARFSKPYCCDPLNCGYEYHDSAEYTELVLRAHRLGLQTGTHAQGDTAIEITLDALEAAMRELPRQDPRHRIEHCGFPRPEDVERIARLGVYPITQPQYIYRYGDEIRRALGERAERLVPLGEFRDAGISFALSSDAPVCPPKPFEAICAAVERTTLNGQVLGGEHQRITVDAALRASTLGAAATMHRERDLGSLEPGKLADFIVLSADPSQVGIDALRQIEVLETWVGAKRMELSADTKRVMSVR